MSEIDMEITKTVTSFIYEINGRSDGDDHSLSVIVIFKFVPHSSIY